MCLLSLLFFVCEYATNETLPEFLKKGDNRKLKWEKPHEVALGLQHLHNRPIIHGNLKANNLFVGSDGEAIVTNSRTLKPY
uniref:Protein kinase domain-containing protein n=1 Tax=Globisporangium ultimum (strain ATCC 200006 / CBS 805.95 / DAOM BR144) TaxID=431595 RepID=K3WV62_GLOUD